MTHRQRKRIKSASERGKRMANARWDLDRARRDFLATHDPIVTGHIMRRIIDINDDTGIAKEIIFRDFDSVREIRKKLANIGLTLSVRKG